MIPGTETDPYAAAAKLYPERLRKGKVDRSVSPRFYLLQARAKRVAPHPRHDGDIAFWNTPSTLSVAS